MTSASSDGAAVSPSLSGINSVNAHIVDEQGNIRSSPTASTQNGVAIAKRDPMDTTINAMASVQGKKMSFFFLLSFMFFV